MTKNLTEKQLKDLIENLASLEHSQWIHWSRNLVSGLNEDEHLNDKRLTRWNVYWNTDYKYLSGKAQESDKIHAYAVIKALINLNILSLPEETELNEHLRRIFYNTRE